MNRRLHSLFHPKPPQPTIDITDQGLTQGVATWGLSLTTVKQALDVQAIGDHVMAGEIMARRGRPRLWTPERLEQLKRLIREGASSKVAARAMGATPDAVRSAAAHYGLKFRRSAA